MEANAPTVVERAHPIVSRASFVGWPLRWKVAAIMVLIVETAALTLLLRRQDYRALSREYSGETIELPSTLHG